MLTAAAERHMKARIYFMKLNNKRTILVGFAFLSICAFWQMYDNLVPKILTETFGIGESISGIIMAADNILALFLLPLQEGKAMAQRCGAQALWVDASGAEFMTAGFQDRLRT